MSDMKQVKVDNWGIYFLQRLKHFFNRTDYCDLTLQFQDNAQLKVHRLVLNACTEYFELLERTCEMYEDCLIMPDDLQAEVVVPIVNFMYTGQLEFEMDLVEKLFQTSQIMNIPVLSKLLDAQRTHHKSRQEKPVYQPKQSYSRSNKRPYTKAFEPIVTQPAEKRAHTTAYIPPRKVTQQALVPSAKVEKHKHVAQSNTVLVPRPQRKHGTHMTKAELADPRPTRYEVPEELDNDNIYDNSFMSISYDSKPLMIHPETSKHYQTKKTGFGLFSEASSSKKMHSQNTPLEVECRKITTNDSYFGDSLTEDSDYYKKTNDVVIKSDPSLLFDQVIENNAQPKMVIETKDHKQAGNIDHAKIISEVLKKYPHLVNSNKNIKLKILENPQTKSAKKPTSKKKELLTPRFTWSQSDSMVLTNVKEEHFENTYEDVLNSKEAARLIALGAENVKGPWICLICGTPGKALHFPTYYKFRRHLVEVHNEKPIPNICEYCGLKSGKRNYLLHHMYTKHNVPPPPSYNFPKCNQCSYIALTEGFLIKHKASHVEQRDFRCNVCFSAFKTSTLLLRHIQATGHKITAERKANLQCVYCQRVFLRESNLYAHLKTSHKMEAKRDGVVEDSDEEESTNVKFEVPAAIYETEDDMNEMQYQIQSRPDGNIHVTRSPATPKQKILNTGLKQTVKGRPRPTIHEDVTEEDDLSPQSTSLNEEMMITEQEYVNVSSLEQDSDQYYMPSMEQAEPVVTSKPSLKYVNTSNEQQNVMRHVKVPKRVNTNAPVQIVMANEQETATPDIPVLFDSEGNPSKALAVLTTLQNAHSDDMMILPDNEYTINVPHGEETTNQNIVVVYSHSMDSSKPYIVDPQYAQSQIITSQNSQFVQAPAVIRPNYITTTPEIIQAAPQVYQQNIEQNIENMQVAIEQNLLPEVLHEEQAVITPTSDTNLITEKELIEVTEGADQSYVTIDGAELQEQRLAESPTFTQPDMEIHIPVTETAEDQAVTLSNADVQQDEVIEEQTYETERVKDKENEVEVFIETQPEITAEGQHMVNETRSAPEQDVAFDVNENNQEIVPEIEESPECMEIAEEIAENEPESTQEGEDIIEVAQPAAVEVPVQSKEKIQSLASEWSEDEEDVPAVVEKEPTAVAQIEVEESIENIQNEMEKGVAGVDTEEETEPEHQELPQDVELPEVSVAQPISSNGNTPAPQEKISSLLNDWDENDSQDENDTTNNGNEVSAEEQLPEEGNNTEESSEALDADDPSKVPLKVVKNLVSDWDEEEEESKE